MTKNELKDYLIKEFESTGFEKEVVVNTNYGKCYITPCGYYKYNDNISPNLDLVEYFMVEGPMPWMGGSSLDDVCNQIINLDSDMAKYENEKEELSNYFDKYFGTSDFDYDWYSDWHKDLYGYRPRFNY